MQIMSLQVGHGVGVRVRVGVGVPGVEVKVGVGVKVGDTGEGVKVRVGVRVGVLVGVLLRNQSADKSSPGAMGLVWFWLQARGRRPLPIRITTKKFLKIERIFILLISKGGPSPAHRLLIFMAAHFKSRADIQPLDGRGGY
jgi:hypothetical protein